MGEGTGQTGQGAVGPLQQVMDMLPAGHIARRVSVTGKVQQVSFRWWTTDRAGELGLDGWVRNRKDGSVELLVVGPEKKVELLLSMLWQGPAAANVEDVRVEEAIGITSVGFFQKPTI